MTIEQLNETIEQWYWEDSSHRAMITIIGENDDHGHLVGGPIFTTSRASVLLKHPYVEKIMNGAAQECKKLREGQTEGKIDTPADEEKRIVQHLAKRGTAYTMRIIAELIDRVVISYDGILRAELQRHINDESKRNREANSLTNHILRAYHSRTSVDCRGELRNAMRTLVDQGRIILSDAERAKLGLAPTDPTAPTQP